MFRIFGIWIVALSVTALNAQVVTKPKFSCDGRTSGYYADVDSGCQAYHMCDGLGRQFRYTCPNATLFQQRMLICDHWYMVNCSKSEDDYAANLRIGQREMPFVDDSESNPYHRTPRPDLLQHPSQSEFDIIYRTGKAYAGNNVNVVGIDSDPKNTTTSATDEPTYSVPSHWSTQFSEQHSTTKPATKDKIATNKKNLESEIKGKPINNLNSVTEGPSVNYKSYFKNTTPVFPKTVEPTSEPPDDLGVLPPLPYLVSNSNKTNISNIDATDVTVNFKSEFKATTPVYPKSVDITSEEPGDLGILPPPGPNDPKNSSQDTLPPPLRIEIVPPPVDSNPQPRNKSEEVDVSSPSKFYQPPKFEPDYTDETIEAVKAKKSSVKSLDSHEWEDLRKKFFIPDYEFPLESVSRPSYDSVLSSFQVSPGLPKK